MLRHGPAIQRGGAAPHSRLRRPPVVVTHSGKHSDSPAPRNGLQSQSAAASDGPPTARLIQAAAALPASERYDRLLRWACGDDGDGHGDGDGAATTTTTTTTTAAPSRRPRPRVSVVEYADARGRGLVASDDVEEGDVLMSVPLSRVFCSEPPGQRRRAEGGGGEFSEEDDQRNDEDEDDDDEDDEEDPWALGMAARLLSLVRAAEARLPRLDGWALWLAALPPRVVTPLEFGAREIAACGEGGAGRGVGAAIRGMQRALRRGAARARRRGELPPGATDADVLWAVQALSSRCFFEPLLAAHLCVPGVDMANHCSSAARSGGSGGVGGGGVGGGGGGGGSVDGGEREEDRAGPSARVEVRRSPEAVQGAHVGDEFFPAPVQGAGANESEFRLVADRALRRGEAVTISYGRWPAEVFFLLFGFVPDDDEGGGRGGGSGEGERGKEAEKKDGGGAPPPPRRRPPLPGDALLLYEGAGELADHVARLLLLPSGGPGGGGGSGGGGGGGGGELAGLGAAAQAWREAPAYLSDEEAFAASRLACTLEGVDARLDGALQALAAAAATAVATAAAAGEAEDEPGGGRGGRGGAAPATVPPPAELVRARLAELLEGYEAASSSDDDHDGDDERMALARSYAAAKAATARAVLATLPPPPALAAAALQKF